VKGCDLHLFDIEVLTLITMWSAKVCLLKLLHKCSATTYSPLVLMHGVGLLY